jgi:hypothetical protein
MFLSLPKSLVASVPHYLDEALLSGFAYERQTQQTNVFFADIEIIAERIYKRWRLSESIGGFKLKMYQSARRLATLEFIYQVNEYKWSLGLNLELVINWLKESENIKAVITCNERSAWEDSPQTINVIDRSRGLYLSQAYRNFNQVEAQYNIRHRRRNMDLAFIRTVASLGVKGARHCSVGSWANPRNGGYKAGAYVPQVILDFDGESILDSFDSCNRAVGEIASAIPCNSFFVAYTGNRGFHIHISSSVFGRPIFDTHPSSEHRLERAIKTITEEPVDIGLFNPSHMYRLTGSHHEKTGRQKKGFKPEEFSFMNLPQIIDAPYKPIWIEESDPIPELIVPMMKEKDVVPDFDDTPAWGEGSSVIDIIMRGVEEGEHWGVERNHIGRNKAAYVLACHLLRKHKSYQTAFHKLKEWNEEKCNPPLNRNELGNCLASASRTVQKDGSEN